MSDGHRFCHACGFVLPPRASDDPLLGTTLPGGYVLRELIGEGGMGRVYRAEQPALAREVAVKIIHPHLASDPVVAPRFLVEARAASRINHPNAVTVFAFGETAQRQPYLVMQLLTGKPLTRVAAEEGPLRPWRIVDLLCQVVGALEQAHAVSIVHGDVKPDNIIVERLYSGDDLVKVIDFGLARLVTDSSTDLMSPHVVGGTPAYMSPQHARGERVDPADDLYSVGVILYELLTGVLPFDQPTTTETLLAILNQAPIDPRLRAPQRQVTDALAAIAMRMLEKEPARRLRSARELSAALAETLERPSAVDDLAPPCAVCGVPNVARRAFCGECGAPLPTGRETQPDFGDE